MNFQLSIAQIVLESASFSHHAEYLSVPVQVPTAQERKIVVSVESRIDEGQSAALVRVRVATAEPPSDPYHYGFEIVVAGLFSLSGNLPKTAAEKNLVTVVAATIVVPFARENLANLTGKGRFGPVWLQPINMQQFVESATEVPEIPGLQTKTSDEIQTESPSAGARAKRPSRKKDSNQR